MGEPHWLWMTLNVTWQLWKLFTVKAWWLLSTACFLDLFRIGWKRPHWKSWETVWCCCLWSSADMWCAIAPDAPFYFLHRSRSATFHLCGRSTGADPGEVKWVNSPPFSEPPSFYFFSYPSNIEIIFDFSDIITKIHPHFKILDPPLGHLNNRLLLNICCPHLLSITSCEKEILDWNRREFLPSKIFLLLLRLSVHLQRSVSSLSLLTKMFYLSVEH